MWTKLIFAGLLMLLLGTALAIVGACSAGADEWRTRVIGQSAECAANHRCARCEANRKKVVWKRTRVGTGYIPVSYAAITPAEMLECGWEPMPNDVCLDRDDCVGKARWETTERN